jgi:hypothetical protein
MLCRKDDKHYARTCKPVRQKCEEFMHGINEHVLTRTNDQDMRVADFCGQRYLPYCEEIVQLTGQPPKNRDRPAANRSGVSTSMRTSAVLLCGGKSCTLGRGRFLQSLISSQGEGNPEAHQSSEGLSSSVRSLSSGSR